mmetsp:Transcript_60967/g.143563  ORF Transcript_60967/g.143563 Transcript_60967/m.143563 type:complete len:232 (-) Transcript_60967:2232-2927(-)
MHGASPLAHGCARLRNRLDFRGHEIWVLDVRFDLLDHLVGNVVLVELKHLVQQTLCVVQKLLSWWPVVVYFLSSLSNLGRRNVEHDAESFDDKLHQGRGVRVLGHLADVGELEVFEHGQGCIEGRQRLCQTRLSRVLDRLALRSLGRRCSLFRLNNGFLLRGNSLILCDFLHQLRDVDLCLRQDRLELDQFDLHDRDVFFRLVQLVETHRQASFCSPELVSLLAQHLFERR